MDDKPLKPTQEKRRISNLPSSRASALTPQLAGMIADLFLVARLVLNNVTLSIAIAAVLVFVFFGLWYLFPWSERRFIRDGSNPVGEQ